MENFNQGYIKIWRKLKNNPIINNHNALILFIHILLRATYKPTIINLKNGKQIILNKGQLIFSRKKWSIITGISENQIRSTIKFLKKYEIITTYLQSNQTIISVINWDNYQGVENEFCKQDHHFTQKKSTTVKEKELINIKNINNCKKYAYSDCFNLYPIKTREEESKKLWDYLYQNKKITNEEEVYNSIQNYLIKSNNSNLPDFYTWLNKNYNI